MRPQRVRARTASGPHDGAKLVVSPLDLSAALGVTTPINALNGWILALLRVSTTRTTYRNIRST